jgi:DNA-binding transcriptional LysR family regulator
MSLRSVNLNLMPILRALLREKNVSRAAEVLGITQPATSAALAKLRATLNDPLLVRAGGRMELSYRGQQLRRQVEEACDLLENIWVDPVFDPRQTERSFTIAARDFIQVVVAPTLMKLLAAQTANVSMQFLEVTAEEFARNRGLNIDFAISNRAAFAKIAAADLIVEPLFEDKIVMVIGKNHRLFERDQITVSDLTADRFLVYLPGFEFLEDRYQDFQENYKTIGPIALRSQNVNSLVLIAMTGDQVALAPSRLINAFSKLLPLRVVGEAFDGETVELCMAWSRWHEFDPAHRWFRGLIKQAAI